MIRCALYLITAGVWIFFAASADATPTQRVLGTVAGACFGAAAILAALRWFNEVDRP